MIVGIAADWPDAAPLPPDAKPLADEVRWIDVPQSVLDSDRHPNYHERVHGWNNRLNQLHPGWQCVYVRGNRAAIVPKTSGLTITMVARQVPQQARTNIYNLYLVQQAQRGWDGEPLYLLDEQGCYLGSYEVNGFKHDAAASRTAHEWELFTGCLLAEARKLPGYNTLLLAALLDYQSRRLKTLDQKYAAVAAPRT
jgi:hypothetical protein